MSFQNFKTNSYCVCHGGYSYTKNIIGEVSFIKKTGREIILLVGQCSMCNRKKSMIITNIIVQAEGLGNFLKTLGTESAEAGKKISN